jgi:sugar lactone lactonase YvrE
VKKVLFSACSFSIVSVVLGCLSFGQTITTYAGPHLPVSGQPAITQAIDVPTSVLLDGGGGFFIAGANQNRIYHVGSDGTLTVTAGTGSNGYNGDGGPATSAQLFYPFGLAADSAGNIFVSDSANQRIRKITTAGIISTVAGNGAEGFSGDGGPATAAQLNGPRGLAVDASGNLFIAEAFRIRKVTPAGIISTVAGIGFPGTGGDGGPATSAPLGVVTGIAVDAAGNLYIADTDNNRVRKVTPGGTITTVAGNGTDGVNGDGGPATAAPLDQPVGVSFDSIGNLFIVCTTIRKVTTAGIISTVAGTGVQNFAGDGGPAVDAWLNIALALAVDSAGNLFIADAGNNRIRKVDTSGIITTVAGNGTYGFEGDGGPATSALLSTPLGLTAVGGDLYFADSLNNLVRKITSTGVIITVAGNGELGFSGDDGPALAAQLNSPEGVAVDGDGNLFIADFGNQRIRKVSTTGVISTIAGNGSEGFGGDGGPATSAELFRPSGIAFDGAGNLLVADSGNSRIRQITPSGVIATVAGNGLADFSGDGGPATSAALKAPRRVASDSAGNLFIADSGNNRIRKIAPSGVISTVAGSGSGGFSGDGGPAPAAQLANPRDMAVTPDGNLFIADTGNRRVREVTSVGTIATVAGNGSYGFSGDGGPASSAQLISPQGLALDPAGNLFISDSGNSRIRKVETSSGPRPKPRSQLTSQ